MLHLEKLQHMINEIEIFDSLGPDDEVMQDDEIIGKMTDEIKRIYILRSQVDQSIRDKMADLIRSNDSLFDNPEVTQELGKAHRFNSLLDELLWFAIRTEFDLWGSESGGVGLRAGWKVVTFKSRRSEFLLDLFRLLH